MSWPWDTTRTCRIQKRQNCWGWIPEKSAAALALQYRDDEDQEIRATVLHCLRRLSLRVERRGHVVARGPDFPPKVDGLLPYLVEFLADSVATIRWAALFALADTREPGAIAPMRSMLADSDSTVRMYAACLLTEMDDHSGVSVLREALQRMVETAKREPYDDCRPNLTLMPADYLVAAMQRVTGESLGAIPMRPLLHSSRAGSARADNETRELLFRWSDWWEQHGARYE